MRWNCAAAGLGCALLASAIAFQPARADAPKPDGGKFSLLVQGKRVGEDSFRLLPDGCDSDVTLGLGPGRELHFHQTLKFKKGQWTQLTTDAGPQGTMTVALAADKSTIKTGDKAAITQKLPAAAQPYGDHSPHLLAFIAAAYDSKKGGEQKFDLIYTEAVGPNGVLVFPAILKNPRVSTMSTGGKSITITRYSLTLTGPSGPLAMELVTDAEKHILLWTVPGQKYTCVREGYDELAK